MTHWKGTMGLYLAFLAILKLIHPEFPSYFIFFLSFVYADKEMDSRNKDLMKIHANKKYERTTIEFSARRYCFFILVFVQ
jgi:hypothetical protein